MPRRRRYDYTRQVEEEAATTIFNEGYEEGYDRGYARGQRDTVMKSGVLGRPKPPARKKKTHRKTAYQSAYSAAYKRLKKKHPRMAFGSLSKKAHAAARKKVK